MIVNVLADYFNKDINTFRHNYFADVNSISYGQTVKHIIYLFLELNESYDIFTVHVQLGVIINLYFDKSLLIPYQ